MNTEEIKKKCEEFRKEYNIVIPFDDGYEIVYKVNGHIRESSDIDNELGTLKKYNDSFWITLNSKLPEPVKKIVITQFVGIFYMFKDSITKEDWDEYFEIEIPLTEGMLEDGYLFAKEILIPEYLFMPYFCRNITKEKKINLKVIANLFKVPVAFVRERSIDLGMIVPKKQEEGELFEK